MVAPSRDKEQQNATDLKMISIISESVWIIKDPAKTFRFQRVQDAALCFSPLGNTSLVVPQQLKPQLQRQGEGAWQAHPSPRRSEALPIGSCLLRRSAGTPLWNHDAKPPLAANFSMRAACVFRGRQGSSVWERKRQHFTSELQTESSPNACATAKEISWQPQ